MCRSRCLVFSIAIASMLAIAGESRAQGHPGDPSVSLMKPMVSTATVNDQARTITIQGGGFGTVAPIVSLGGVQLVVTNFDAAAQIIMAFVPTNVDPGTYDLELTTSTNMSTALEVTIGTAPPRGLQGLPRIPTPQPPIRAIGVEASISPQGPGGPVGLQGATGPQGPVGPQGPIGSQGPQGSQGSVGLRGPVGPAGREGSARPPGLQGLSWRGPWATAQTYARNDAVSFNGSSYISLVAGNAGNQPDATPTMWNLLAQVGAQGPQGPQGPTGAQGVPGPPGLAGPQGPPGESSSLFDARQNRVGTVVQLGGEDRGAIVRLSISDAVVFLRADLHELSLFKHSSWLGPLYESSDCSGTPYVMAFEEADVILPAKIAPPGRTLYVPTQLDVPETHLIGSGFEGDLCRSWPASETHYLYPMKALVDLDQLFVPPFTVR